MFTDRSKAATYPFLDEYTNVLKKAEREIIGRDKEMRSLLAAFSRPELSNVLLLGDAGSGKGHPNDTPIAVADERGYAQFGDLKVGDHVFDENGHPVKVIGVFPQGPKRAYRVKFHDGTSVICNDEHLWAVRTRKQHYTDSPYQVMSLADMMDVGIKQMKVRSDDGRTEARNRWYVPVSRPVWRPTVELPLDPYVLGVCIGDGCLTDSMRTFEVSSNDKAVIAAVAARLGAVSYKQRPGCYNWIFEVDAEEYGHKWLQLKDVADRSEHLSSVFGKYSAERRIPRIYMLGSVEQRYLLLQGLMDTDGCVTSGDRLNCSYFTKSEGLAHDVQELAASLGMRTSITSNVRKDDAHDDRPEYEVYFRIPIEDRRSLFRHSHSVDKYDEDIVGRVRKFNRHYDDMAIVETEDLGYDCEMTCIYVDSPTHLYLVGYEHIVTHNTALVQGAMVKDANRTYLEVDLSKMIANLSDPNEMAARLKQLFDETAKYSKQEGKELVLFMDEFHQVVQLSSAAVEALKPLLADSGTRGIRVIAATTFPEFKQYISPNQPLVERLMRINVHQPDKDVTVAILKGMAKRYGVENQFYNDHIYEMIYEFTNRYVPANSQPRKSILVLDAMVGWHRSEGRPMDMRLLADVLKDTEGVDVAFSVDAKSIKKELDKVVLSQTYATMVIEQRLQLCVADLNDKSKPMSSFLFTGSTGTGKSTRSDEMIPAIVNGEATLVRVDHLRAGKDYVFNAEGEPVKVLGVFPQGERELYRVTLGDGRCLDVSGNHLWGVYPNRRSREEGLTVYSTETLIKKGLVSKQKSGREAMKYVIPMNGAVQWPNAKLDVDPYVVGAFIGNGLLRDKSLTFSSADEFTVEKIKRLIGAADAVRDKASYSWTFGTGEVYEKSGHRYRMQTADVFASVPELIGTYSGEKFIPEKYKLTSIEQRWELIRGLFDTDGSIEYGKGERFNVRYSTTSERLAKDVQWVLYSLGIASSIKSHQREGKNPEFDIHVKIDNRGKHLMFSLPRKLERAEKAAEMRGNKQRHRQYDYVGIRSIEPLGETADCTCIYVDDEEHLYQAGEFVVTHNTELTKQLTKLLFADDKCLIRFDMTEYANPDSLERFRDELTSAVWARANSVVLLDEIEKACSPVTRLLLQVLDDGRLSDRNGREVSFTNAYIIMTTNTASEIYKTIAQYNVDDEGSGKFMKRYDRLIRKSISATSGDNRFPPELLGRIDVIVPFQPLSESTMKRIVQMKLRKLKEDVRRKHNVDLRIDSDVIRYLVEDNLTTDSDAGGARSVMAKLESEVTTSIARFINAHPNVAVLGVRVEGDMATDNKTQLESEAYIRVVAAR